MSWLDPDRLFPADPHTRGIARGLFDLIESAPIISPHGHVDPSILVEDTAYSDPATLLVSSDHYVTRQLHASGIGLDDLLRGEPRIVWRLFAERWDLFAGTASGFWIKETLATIFGVDEAPSGDNADALFDDLSEQLKQPAFRPRALFDSFGIEVLATTDDPLDDLGAHEALRSAADFAGRVIPTFRPDAYLNPAAPGWSERIDRLGGSGYRGYLGALADRRQYFIRHGAVSADHGVERATTVGLDHAEAARLFDRGRSGDLTADEAALFAAHMLVESARMSVDDGLVMTVHAGVLRNHHSDTFNSFGADTGHDIPVAGGFTENLRPLLERFGTAKDFHLILFTVDESLWSRELAPLAGFYPSVYIGAPWWFLDAPDSIGRFRAATTETAGFYRGSGFVDDTRAFMSIAARHAMARRVDAGFLARLVVEGRVDLAQAERIALDTVGHIPRQAFKL